MILEREEVLTTQTQAPPATENLYSGELQRLPPDAMFLRILGVNYVHLKMEDEGDLYITEHGLPFLEHLRPENWYEPQWFQSKRERLHGTSAVYRVPTKPVINHRRKSIELVVKWSRVGEEIPADTFTVNRAINAEFNSPFEEFSLVEEMRSGTYGSRTPWVLAQKPLAIYVPPERMQLWQSGRSRDRILRKVARHASVEIDILRSYILLYGWIKGINAVDAYRRGYLDQEVQNARLAELTGKVEQDLRRKGFIVADHKPSHFIVRMRDQRVRRRNNGNIAYALVDYELLSRTPEYEEQVKAALRSRYLYRMRDRFHPTEPIEFPPHLKPASVSGVDYIYGRAESTGGILWVVGKDPELFHYFLPERWRHKQIQLSRSNRTWYTQTKDRIHMVWKVCRVGDLPPGDLNDPAYKPILLQGYNSPFEEFAIALELMSKGVKTTYPRAIYVTAAPSELTGNVLDARRFERMRHVLSPEGLPVLQLEPDYITIYGYWRGLEDDSAPEDVGYWMPIDALQACTKGLVTPHELEDVLIRQRESLAKAGFEDVNLKADHVLLSFRTGGTLKKDAEGKIELRQCNMEMVRRLPM